MGPKYFDELGGGGELGGDNCISIIYLYVGIERCTYSGPAKVSCRHIISTLGRNFLAIDHPLHIVHWGGGRGEGGAKSVECFFTWDRVHSCVTFFWDRKIKKIIILGLKHCILLLKHHNNLKF